jgi:hypothetical protein
MCFSLGCALISTVPIVITDFFANFWAVRIFQMSSLLYRDVFWKYVDANTKRELGLDFRDDGEFYMNFNRDFLKVSPPVFVIVFFAPTSSSTGWIHLVKKRKRVQDRLSLYNTVRYFHELINWYIVTKAICHHLKTWLVKGLCSTCLSEFIDWREIQSVMLVFSTQLGELLALVPSLWFNCPPSSPLPCVTKNTVYTCTVQCAGGGGFRVLGLR